MYEIHIVEDDTLLVVGPYEDWDEVTHAADLRIDLAVLANEETIPDVTIHDGAGNVYERTWTLIKKDAEEQAPTLKS